MKKIAKTIMIQGTGSNVGKSVTVTALCRILKQDGFTVCPFKSQNMALNSFVTKNGDEMGRAQVVQAEAAGIEPEAFMNPILIKPMADSLAQIIFMGKIVKNMTAVEYEGYKSHYISYIKEILDNLKKRFDIVIIEGAGSPAEINLLKNDIVNMKTAEIAESPVILVGDIDKGGIFASFYGTVKLLPKCYQKYFKALLINKFRGDRSLLNSGEKIIENKLKIPVLGVIPYFRDILIDEEDSVDLEKNNVKLKMLKNKLISEKNDLSKVAFEDTLKEPNNYLKPIKIAVISIPHISNFTDFNSLEAEKGVILNYCQTIKDLSIFDPDIIIIPGSKSTIRDLLYLRNTGLENEIKKRALKGTFIIGICGGFQMLGKLIKDEEGNESINIKEIKGMELLDMETNFCSSKITKQVKFKFNKEIKQIINNIFNKYYNNDFMNGYEIHMGTSILSYKTKTDSTIVMPLFNVWSLDETSHHDDGILLIDNIKGLKILGTYIHGLFDNSFAKNVIFAVLFYGKRRNLQNRYLSLLSGFDDYDYLKQLNYDKLADHFRQNMDMDKFYEILKKGIN